MFSRLSVSSEVSPQPGQLESSNLGSPRSVGFTAAAVRSVGGRGGDGRTGSDGGGEGGGREDGETSVEGDGKRGREGKEGSRERGGSAGQHER